MTAASTPDRADVRRNPEVAGQLAADLQGHGLDLAQLQARSMRYPTPKEYSPSPMSTSKRSRAFAPRPAKS